MNAKLLKLLANDTNMGNIYKKIFYAQGCEHNSTTSYLSEEQAKELENQLFTLEAKETKLNCNGLRFYKILW